MYLERIAYSQMLAWKELRDRATLDGSPRLTVLKLEGPKRTGKTYLAQKFGNENYKRTVYVNMADKRHIETFNAYVNLPANKRLSDNEFWRGLFTMYNSGFIDSPDTLVIVDEIQDSEFLYNSIRNIRGSCKFHFLVTGSYLGFVSGHRNFFDPADDLHKIVVPSLTFQEYLMNIGEYDRYLSLDLFGRSAHEDYHIIQKHYDNYTVVGGYPAVVVDFFEQGSMANIKNMHKLLYDVTIDECSKYLGSVDSKTFRDICSGVPTFVMNKKKGELIDYNKYMLEENVFDYNKVQSVVYWLTKCRVLGFCSRAVECDTRELIYGSRLYYMDIGMASYCYRHVAEEDPKNVNGAIDENFAYLEMYRRDPFTTELKMPIYGTYKNGEIDYLVFSKETCCMFGIDVKHGSGSSKTANKLLNEEIVDYVLYARSGSCGGFGKPGVLTIPIYLLNRFDFDAQHDNPPVKPSRRRKDALEVDDD
jgi:predicted AAA+ superfamily ATPase